ncbi:type II toxin-antitoxin system VapC family toxin [Spirosoma fluminis]
MDGFRAVKNAYTKLVVEYTFADQPIWLTPTILQEVLQGIKDDCRYNQIKEGLLTHTMLSIDPVEAAIGAAELYRFLRKKGVTIRKPNNCLIAHYAILHNIPILHNDADFNQIARFTALRPVTP